MWFNQPEYELKMKAASPLETYDPEVESYMMLQAREEDEWHNLWTS